MINTDFFVCVHTTFWHIMSTSSNWHQGRRFLLKKIYTQREIYATVAHLYISSSYYFSFPVLLFPIQFNICKSVSGCDKLATDRMINTVFFVRVHTTFWHIKSTNSNWHKLDDSCWKAYFHTCNVIKRCHNKSSYFKTFVYQEVNKIPGQLPCHMRYDDIVL